MRRASLGEESPHLFLLGWGLLHLEKQGPYGPWPWPCSPLALQPSHCVQVPLSYAYRISQLLALLSDPQLWPCSCLATWPSHDTYAPFVSTGAVQYRLALKGCSSIKEAACNYLSAGNIAVGNVVFRHLQCSPALPSSATCSSGLGPATLHS